MIVDVKRLSTMTEQELRDSEPPWPETPDALMAFVNALVDRPHDYGTCVYAMSLCAVAAYNYVCHVLRTTGFQAGCADLDIIQRIRRIKNFRLMVWDNMLYPQYEDKMQKTITPDTWEWLQAEAKKNLAIHDEASERVRAHWQSIVDGVVPFGYWVEKD